MKGDGDSDMSIIDFHAHLGDVSLYRGILFCYNQ